MDEVTCELRIDGRDRRCVIQLPPEPAGTMPLVLVLHGNSPDAGGEMMREWTTFDRQAAQRGWAVGYPDGVGGCWADARGATTADEAGVDDVKFLSQVIDWMAENHGTARDRTVVAGMSNGAFMAHHLATRAADRVAVIATVAGQLPASLREVGPTHAVSALLLHGDADKISPIEGGYSRRTGPNGERRGQTLSLQETLNHWSKIDRCQAEPETTTTPLSSRTKVNGGVGGTTVEAWTLFDSGHNWPGTPPMEEWSEVATQEFDGAEEICKFAEKRLIEAKIRQL